ncbi:helix-turn-helix transcriptional regulator [Dyadobacter sp. CY345]|uniref:winged helix-turn-helix transcriptional regulator n=1 Tax=Dyadobacter sp. CY345 TaxID=2909335 RepID=UPI001F3F7750|nr:helix-turn-helix domain-containing protein [Dyadobacter sp. CY345]MCF2443525.1 helix-turn-helix transcriptional regulator [Dyadobacter sp. CY345]
MATKTHCLTPATNQECKVAQLTLQDTLDVVGGKWKLVLISILRGGKLKFRELSREAGISPRVLSKELKDLEMHDLVTRTVQDTRPITVEYELTPYSETLSDMIIAMHAWGKQHREKVIHKTVS